MCIDLDRARLTKRIAALSYDCLLPDVILAELTEPPGATLLQLGFVQVSFLPEEVEQVMKLQPRYPNETVNDLFALHLSREKQGILITGDAGLRKAAQREHVEAHGVLWLLDLMVHEGVLDKLTAADSLESLMGSGSWLPRVECEKRIRVWRDTEK